jgi:predicted nucleotidyltransferase
LGARAGEINKWLLKLLYNIKNIDQRFDMMNKESILAFLKKYKEQKKQEYHIKKLGLFGSFARDEATQDSDIDIIVDLSKPNLFNLCGIMLDIKEHFDKNIDIVAIREDMKPNLKKRIDKEALYV